MRIRGSTLGAVLAATLLPAMGAHATPERHLPRGEEAPHFIEIVFSSPVGEVQFTQVGRSGHSGFLRNSHGNMMGFSQLSGSEACETWFQSSKKIELPRGCEFSFYDAYDGRTLSVRSEEMTETDLFQAASGKLRGFDSSAPALTGGT